MCISNVHIPGNMRAPWRLLSCIVVLHLAASLTDAKLLCAWSKQGTEADAVNGREHLCTLSIAVWYALFALCLAAAASGSGPMLVRLLVAAERHSPLTSSPC